LDGEGCRRKGGRSAARRSAREPGGRRPAGAVGILQRPRRKPAPSKRITGEWHDRRVPGGCRARPRPACRPPRLSKDAYRRRKAQLDQELARLGERKVLLESALQDPGVHGNFVELRRVSGRPSYVNEALAAAEEAWLGDGGIGSVTDAVAPRRSVSRSSG
jgi:hypothetical protein